MCVEYGYIDYGDIDDRVIKLIWGLSSAKYLSISESTMKVVNVGPVDNLPRFHGLTKLELFVGPSMWNLLLHFLKSAPNLEILVLNMGNMEEGRRKKRTATCCRLVQCCISKRLKLVDLRR